MTSGYPDWTRAIRLLGIDGDGNPVTVLLDADGRLYSLIVGQDAGGNPLAVRVDGSGQMIMVPRGQSGHYMAIDSDGYMTAILKGAYAGALRTIGLDDEGRITAYLADAEDQWGKTVNVGNADLAARLGYPQTWDYRGQVLHWTDFGKGMGAYSTYSDGAGAGVSLDPTLFLHGGYAVKLTGGSDGDRNAGIKIITDINGNPPAGCAVLVASDSMPNEWFMKVTYRIAGHYHHYWIRWLRYSGGEGQIYVLKDDGAWDSKSGMAFTDGYARFHWVKLVGNGALHNYIRLVYHRQEVDLTSYAERSAYDGLPAGLEIDISVVNAAGENKSIWVDSVVVTAQEPL